jgi:hypothetical protein
MIRRACTLVLLTAALTACSEPAPTSARKIAVYGLDPPRGPLPGGTTIVIDGEGFAPLDAAGTPPVVIVGRAAATDVGVIDQYTLTATTPPGDVSGVADVIVAQPDGYGRLDRGFTYNPTPQLLRISPDRGDVAGGTPILIDGLGFTGLDGGDVTVTIGDLAATDVQVVSDDRISAVTPPGPGFAHTQVVVTNRNGTSPVPADFVYTAKGLIVGSNRNGPPYGLFYVDPATGLTSRIFAIESDPVAANGLHSLAADPDGTLWATTHAFSEAPRIVHIDPFLPSAPAGSEIQDPDGNGAGMPLVIDCKDLELVAGVLYCAVNGRLYTIDRATGSATKIGADSVRPYTLAHVAGTTYALLGSGEAAIAPIDLATATLGNETPITIDGAPLQLRIGKATSYQSAMYFLGNSTGDGVPLFTRLGDVPIFGLGKPIYRVDVATGQATLVGVVPFQTTALTAVE